MGGKGVASSQYGGCARGAGGAHGEEGGSQHELPTQAVQHEEACRGQRQCLRHGAVGESWAGIPCQEKWGSGGLGGGSSGMLGTLPGRRAVATAGSDCGQRRPAGSGSWSIGLLSSRLTALPGLARSLGFHSPILHGRLASVRGGDGRHGFIRKGAFVRIPSPGSPQACESLQHRCGHSPLQGGKLSVVSLGWAEEWYELAFLH